MKERISLSMLTWKILFSAGGILFCTLWIVFRSEFKWYWHLMFALSTAIFLVSLYFTMRVRIIFDHEKRKITYFGFNKHVIGFDEIESCQNKTEKRTGLDLTPTTYYYLCIKKTDGSIVQISTNLVAVKKDSLERIRTDIAQKVNNAIGIKKVDG